MTSSEERLQQYLDGTMSPEQRASFEQEMLQDGTLMDDAYAEINVREALAEHAHARRVALKPRPRKSAVAFLTVAAAASIAFVAFILPRPDNGDEVFRGGAGGAPVAVVPVGETEQAPARFVWTRDPQAAHYRLEIYGHEGDRLHVATTRDTFFVPEGLAVPRTGSWRATTIDSAGIGMRSTGQVDFHRP